ncbi:MAG: hypothetical protein ACR2KQ_02365 [Actinomycetota bacterium]
MSKPLLPGETARVGALAIVRASEPTVFLAEDAETISRVLALHLVAQVPAEEVSSPSRLKEMREALMEERWADAVLAWIAETATAVDVYEGAPKVWTGAELDATVASMEIRLAPLFSDSGSAP